MTGTTHGSQHGAGSKLASTDIPWKAVKRRAVQPNQGSTSNTADAIAPQIAFETLATDASAISDDHNPGASNLACEGLPHSSSPCRFQQGESHGGLAGACMNPGSGPIELASQCGGMPSCGMSANAAQLARARSNATAMEGVESQPDTFMQRPGGCRTYVDHPRTHAPWCLSYCSAGPSCLRNAPGPKHLAEDCVHAYPVY